jgi:hypothetical protein
LPVTTAGARLGHVDQDAIIDYYTTGEDESARLAARAVERDPVMQPMSAHLLVAARA